MKLLISFLLTFYFISSKELQCEDEKIEHCTKCNTGDKSDSCSTCEDKYFPFFSDLLCYPCNDSLYGQEGCIGKCNSSNITYNRHALCEEGGCKEGFYYLNGNCYNCSATQEGCKKCTYKKQENQTYGNFICLECESNNYKLTEYGKCQLCSDYGCEECHYEKNYTKTVCDKCYDGYYLDLNGQCKECRTSNIDNGYCRICSETGTKYDSCYCDYDSIKIGESKCTKCPANCDKCEYDNKTNSIECISCHYNYRFNSNKDCIYCGDGCYSCTIDKSNNPICTSCYTGYALYKSSCYKCTNYCNKCEVNESSKYKNETICKECNYDFVINEQKECISCNNVPDLNCNSCFYNETTKKYGCLQCNSPNYAFINNTYECLDNSGTENEKLKNCRRAFYEEKTKSYECLECSYNTKKFLNEAICKYPSDFGLNDFCQDIENLGTSQKPLYSCAVCQSESVIVTTNIKDKTKDCHYRDGNLSFCVEGKIDENGNNICTKCIEHATLNSSGICKCNSDSFAKNGKCYKCDDKVEGNIGCIASKGCYFNNSIYNLVCNECKKGYYLQNGKCNSCSNSISNCETCHLDKNGGVRCDTCKGIYTLNTTNNTIDECILNECEEYPDIAPGCIICKDKLNEYKKNNKCQACKYGYFKTKSESCIYCRSEQYGGPACYECGYEEDQNGSETNNIICKDCNSTSIYIYPERYNSILSSDGKCYSCQYDLSEKCMICDFNKDNKNSNELQCLFCINGYYVDSDGRCISFIDKIETVPNCNRHEFNISNFSFYFDNDPNDASLNNFYNLNATIYNDLNKALRNLKTKIKPICKRCDSDYYLNDKGECQKLNFKDCIGSFMIKDPNQLIDKCESLCNSNEYPFIYLIFTNGALDLETVNYKNISDFQYIRNIRDILSDFNNSDNMTQNFILKSSLCYELSNEALKKKFEGCINIIYIPKTNSYHCLDCEYEYEMDNKTDTCKLREVDDDDISYHCEGKNIGNASYPIYNCTKCNYSHQALVSYDFGIKYCLPNYTKGLEGCLEANASTKYYNTYYNCSACETYYLPYYSQFYRRNICQEVFTKIIKKKNISLNIFEGQEYIEKQNGTCESNFFTPNGTYCYKCDNDIVGMPGCKGNCDFSLKRNNEIICKGECKEGYLESSKGICKSCGSINRGCYKCHYKNNSNYLFSKKSRKFQCDYCLEGYIKTLDGTCKKCSDIGLGNCKKCEIDENSKNYKCIICSEFSFMDDSGHCRRCTVTGAILNNKCIHCSSTSEGGIKGCSYCQSNEEGNGIICKQCEKEYILLSTNNSCLEREKNKSLYEFDSCLELKEQNNKLICSRCKPNYSLLKIGEEIKCSYTPTLFDENFNRHYYNSKEFSVNNYNFRQLFFFPCKESTNIGTNENPLYSCNKCYNIFDNDIDYEYYEDFIGELSEEDYFHFDYHIYYENKPMKVNDSTIKNSYCFKAHYHYRNCSEATYHIINGTEIFNCTKCIKYHELTTIEKILKDHHFEYYGKIDGLNNSINVSDYYLCTYNEDNEDKCLVNYCQKCASDMNYFCSDCISSEYEVNNITGSCVKRVEVPPAVTWKNIYKLNMAGLKSISGRIIKGPTFKIRGITFSQINKGYVFLFYLTFKLKNQLRYLEENIKAPSICEINEDIEKSSSKFTIVDVDCVVNITNTPLKENYELIKIEGGNLNLSIKADQISNKIPDFDLPIVFEMINYNEYYESNIFNLTLNGKLKDNNMISEKKNVEIEMNEIEKKMICDFRRNDQLDARFDCLLKVEDNAKEYNLTFKNNEVKIGDGYPNIYIESLEEIKLSNKNEDKTNNNSFYQNKSKGKSHATLIIVLGIVAGVIVLVGVGIILMFIKKANTSKVQNLTNLQNISSTIQANSNTSNSKIS